MGFFGDLGNFASDLFTGRWTGGGQSGGGVVGDVKADPWVLAAPAAAIAAPFVLPEIGAAAGGLAAAGGAADVAGGGALADLGLSASPEALGAFAADPAATGGATWLTDAGISGGTDLSGFGGGLAGGADTTGLNVLQGAGGYGGATSFGPATDFGSFYDAVGAPGGAFPDYAPAAPTSPGDTAFASAGDALTPPAPQNLADQGQYWAPPGGSSAPTPPAQPGGLQGALKTLTDPSQWTLSGMAKGAGVLAAGGALGANLLKGTGTSAAQDRISNDAAALQAQFGPLVNESNQLRSYLQNGTLPPALQAQVTQIARAQKARLIANAAANGRPTDPRQNTQLAQDLQAADNQALITAGTLEQQLFTAGQQLLSTGLNTAKLSADLYTTLANMDRQDAKDVTDAISKFAASLGGAGAGGLRLTAA